MQIKAVLFDVDGTLVDSNSFHVTAWDQVFREAGYSFPRERLHSQIGKGGDNYVPALLPDASEEEQQRLREAHRQLFTNRYIDQVRPFPGAAELLRKVRDSGRKAVLATSASREELSKHLNSLGGEDSVDGSTSKDDVEHSKPAPDIFEAARQAAGVETTEALVIGDTPYDIEAAKRSGLKSIAVRSGGFDDEELSGAEAIYDDVAALVEGFGRSPINR